MKVRFNFNIKARVTLTNYGRDRLSRVNEFRLQDPDIKRALQTGQLECPMWQLIELFSDTNDCFTKGEIEIDDAGGISSMIEVEP